MSEVIAGIAGSGKTRHCLQRCCEALAEGREVLALVPNREEAALLRGRLLAAKGGKAIFLPGILYFRTLTARILDSALPGWSLRTSLSRRLHLRRLLDERREHLGSLTESSRTPGLLAALAQVFGQLEEGDVLPADLRALAGPRRRSASASRLQVLAELYEAYSLAQEQSLSLDETQAMKRATACLREGPRRWAAALGGDSLLVVDGFSDFTPLQIRFLEALLPCVGEALIALNLDPGDLERGPGPPSERLHELAARFASRPGWTLRRLEETHRFREAFLARTAQGLFRVLPGEGKAEPGEALQLIAGATRRDEVEGIVREIRHRLAAGLPAGRMAVFFWQETYAELLSDALEKEGIPFRCAFRQPLAQSAVADAFLSLMDWGAGAEGARDLPQRLRGGYVSTPDGILAEILADARARGVPSGQSWDEHLAAWRRESPDAGWDWLDWKAGWPVEPLSGAEFLGQIARPLVALLAARLGARLAESVGDPERAGEGFREASLDLPVLGRILAVAETVAAEALPAAEARQTPRLWAAHLRAALEMEELPRDRGQEGGALLVGNPRDLRVPELDLAFVCGLNQGIFPPPLREHPLLKESERQALNARFVAEGRDSRLSVWKDLQAEARYHFHVAVTRASARLVLSWSQRDLQGREILPSFYLDEIGRICGELPKPLIVPALSLEEKLRDPLDRRGLLRDTLLASRRGEAAELAGAAEDWLRRRGLGEQLEDARRPRAEPELAALGAHLERLKSFSASGLESYAQCPYRFLMEKLLGMEEEEVFEAGALEEGKTYHKILQLFFADWDGDCEPADEALAERLESLHERALELLVKEESLRALLSPRFRAERPRRLRVLSRFLRRDLERLRASGYRPDASALERRFRLASTALPGPEAGEPFDLRGIVDREDLAPGEGRLILDYKRGEKQSEPPDAPEPRLFQLALYALASGDQALGAAYYAMRAKTPLRGYFREETRDVLKEWAVRSSKGAQWLDDAQWQAWLAGVALRVRVIIARIRAGRLEAMPVEGEETCSTCDFAQLCRWRADEAAGRTGS